MFSNRKKANKLGHKQRPDPAQVAADFRDQRGQIVD